jgi:hypothetical protein
MPWDPERRRNFDRGQKEAVKLVGNPKFREAFEEMHDDPDALERAHGNPKGFLEGKGIALPAEAEVRLEQGSCCYKVCLWGFCACVCTDWWTC